MPRRHLATASDQIHQVGLTSLASSEDEDGTEKGSDSHGYSNEYPCAKVPWSSRRGGRYLQTRAASDDGRPAVCGGVCAGRFAGCVRCGPIGKSCCDLGCEVQEVVFAEDDLETSGSVDW